MPPCGSSTRSLGTASSVHVHSTCTVGVIFLNPIAVALRSGGPLRRQFLCDQPAYGARFGITCALPFRLTAHLPALSSQSRHLPPLVARSFLRNPTIPSCSTRVLVLMCRFSRYEGSPAPPTSTAGRVPGVVGRRGLLCVISCGGLQRTLWCAVTRSWVCGGLAISGAC